MVETLPIQRQLIRQAKAEFGLPVLASPITLKRRPTPATMRLTSTRESVLSSADPRQFSLFGACWTLGSLKHVAEEGAASATYFETAGCLGLLERDQELSSTRPFPDLPLRAYPTYHVFLDLAESASGSLLSAESSSPLFVAAIATVGSYGTRVLIANMSGDTQPVRVEGIPLGEITVRNLDNRNVAEAISYPQRFRQSPGRVLKRQGSVVVLEMLPHSLSRLDLNRSVEDTIR
jgi:hypothetical protein